MIDTSNKRNLVILILCLLLLISIINQFWLFKNLYYSKSGVHKINYFDDNMNKWPNVNIRTFSYIYPKHMSTDRCYTNDCKADLIDQRLQSFHDEISKNNKMLILQNQFNVAPIALSVSDQNIISSINNYNNNNKGTVAK